MARERMSDDRLAEIRQRVRFFDYSEKEIAAARQWQAAHPERARINQRRAYRVYYRLRKLERETERRQCEELAG